MNKLFVTIAAVGLVLSGCAKVENERYDVPDPNILGFSASTSRAAVNNLTSLQGDTGGFVVYGTTANQNTTWYQNVDGKNYAFASGAWGWVGDDAVWPASDASYPMNFYAIYPVVTPSDLNPGNALSNNVKIAATAATQVDMLSAKATANTKPASGQLTLTFKHILSKVNFGVIAGHDMSPYVQSVAIRNVHSESTYNYMTQAWNGTTAILTGYTYYSDTASPFTTVGTTTEDDPAEIYGGDHANNLMLMPQSAASTGGTGAPAAWDKTETTIASQAYVEVIYRIKDNVADTTPGDYIGFLNASTYTTIYGSTGITAWDPYSGVGTETGQYNGALFVKAGFPLDLEWVPGKGYVYNICLGTADSTNGYYLSEYYYDDAGNETGVPIKGKNDQTVTPGDPVTEGTIDFDIKVEDWDDTGAATPLQ